MQHHEPCGETDSTVALECENQLTPWYSCVPTDSNSADAPSRLVCKGLLAAGVEQTVVDVLECWQGMQLLSLKWGEEQSAAVSPAENVRV